MVNIIVKDQHYLVQMGCEFSKRAWREQFLQGLYLDPKLILCCFLFLKKKYMINDLTLIRLK